MNLPRIFLLTWLLLAGINIYVFAINRNAALKRTLLPWLTVLVGLLLLFFTVFAGFQVRIIFLFMVAYSVISYLNIRYRIRFCDACGKMLINYFALEPPDECSKCGARLR
jgi:hypothetical protein